MSLRRRLQPWVTRLLVPIARRYLSRTRRSRYDGVTVMVPPGVFHPGMYLSTRFMLRHLRGQALAGKRLWEIGAGSGMVSIWCARQGARVLATDISTAAVAAIASNAAANGVSMDVRQADLFDGLEPVAQDWIIINPPYYPKNPANETEFAFYCGEGFEYFHRLWAGLRLWTHAGTEIRMVLSEDCDLDRIFGIAAAHGWKQTEVDRQKKLWELNYIFSLQDTNH